MATLEQCRTALEDLAAQMSRSGGSKASDLDRSLSVHVPDLGTTFSGRLHDGRLTGITTDEAPKAQVRLTVASDDLVALTSGRLGFAGAWASGRLKVDASMLDLLKLRSLM